LTARRGENVLVTIVLPVVVLLFFASTSIVPVTAGRPVDFLLPGVLALAVISTSLVNLGIATAYERHYGVLKLLGGSPLPRASLIAAKMLAVLVVEVVQFALLFAVALALLGWRPAPGSSTGLIVVGLLLGTLAFAGIGLAMAGSLRAEATLAGANGVFLALLLLGGIVVPLGHLPAALAAVAGVLPASALSDLLRIALGDSAGDLPSPVLLLAVWAIGASVIAARTFRWE